jgi:hypothetical protein
VNIEMDEHTNTIGPACFTSCTSSKDRMITAESMQKRGQTRLRIDFLVRDLATDSVRVSMLIDSKRHLGLLKYVYEASVSLNTEVYNFL